MVDEAELDRRIAQALEAQRIERDENPIADTPLWLAHHWPSRYDRCIRVGGHHVCRRCAVLYPVAILVAFAAGLGLRWPESWDVWMYWLLPMPGVVEFVLDVFGVIRHRPLRQVVVSALLAVAYGNLLWRYSNDPTDGLVWTVVLVQTGICGVAAVVSLVLRRSWIDVDTQEGTVTRNG